MSYTPGNTPPERLFSFSQLFIEHVLFSFQEEFQPRLSTLQLRALMCLHEHGPQTMSELAERLLIPRQQMTQVIDRLSEMELINRVRNESDRRVIRIVWSEAGRAQFRKNMMRFWDDFYARVHTLPQQDAHDFMHSVDTLRRLLPQISCPVSCERRKEA